MFSYFNCNSISFSNNNDTINEECKSNATTIISGVSDKQPKKDWRHHLCIINFYFCLHLDIKRQ